MGSGAAHACMYRVAYSCLWTLGRSCRGFLEIPWLQPTKGWSIFSRVLFGTKVQVLVWACVAKSEFRLSFQLLKLADNLLYTLDSLLQLHVEVDKLLYMGQQYMSLVCRSKWHPCVRGPLTIFIVCAGRLCPYCTFLLIIVSLLWVLLCSVT